MNATKTTVAQLQMRGGMAYVIQLQDGRFIIIDGGEAATERRYQMNKKVLYTYLKARSGGDKIHIACWMISHFHSDHVDVATRFIKELKNELIIERFLYNFAPTVKHFTADMQEEEISREAAWLEAIDLYPCAERLTLRKGESLTLSNARIDILTTAEDPYPKNPTNPNFISSVWKIVFDGGKSFMVLGDAMTERLTALVDRTTSIYCDEQTLKSDVMQTAHHGLCVGREEEYEAITRLYKAIAPSVVFWPQNEHRFFADPWCRDPKHTYHKFLFDTAGKKNFNQAYTTIVDMSDLSITFEKTFDEAD